MVSDVFLPLQLAFRHGGHALTTTSLFFFFTSSSSSCFSSFFLCLISGDAGNYGAIMTFEYKKHSPTEIHQYMAPILDIEKGQSMAELEVSVHHHCTHAASSWIIFS